MLYTAVGSLLMLIGIIVRRIACGQRARVRRTRFDLPTLLATGVPEDAQLWLFLAFAAAFAVKAGLFPLHGWVPDAYSEAPDAGGRPDRRGDGQDRRLRLRALLPAALSRMRCTTLTPLMATLAVVGILYFALQALVADDFKRLLAYVSISHMGVIVLGDLRAQRAGLSRARVVQMVNHGIIIARALPDRRRHSRRARDAAAERLRRAGDAAALAGDGVPDRRRWRRWACLG